MAEETLVPREEAIRQAEIRIMRKERSLRNLTILLALVVILCSAVVVVQYRQNRVARANSVAILNIIKDCTEPGGKCYEQGLRTRLLLENENAQVRDHRDRNELLHDVICKREGEIANKLDLELVTECPPRIAPNTDILPTPDGGTP